MHCSANTVATTTDRILVRAALVAAAICFFSARSHATENSTPIDSSPGRASPGHANSAGNEVDIDIGAGNLGDALRQLATQASLQLLYEPSVVEKKHSALVKGRFTPETALKELFAGTDISWRFINGRTAAIFLSPKATPTASPVQTAVARKVDSDMTVLADVEVTGQSAWWSASSSDAVFGFSKPLLETPRSVSHVSADAIDTFSLSAVEDLLRVVPGVFTTTRFGVQGSVDIRGVPADTYFRGMRRLTLQGHGRSVLAAMDSIDVVGGPVSPLHGMGKIGGYVNFIPKSGRSKTGQYLSEAHGFAQVIGGEYNRRELSLGFGGPVALTSIGKQGGYYIYALLEDSDSYTEAIPVKQKLFQAATSIDDMVGSFRLETGINYQESRTSGALVGRLTQQLVDRGSYIGGSPLVNLDLNGNGTIGYLEMQQASPVAGELTLNNQPLQQVFKWPTDAAGRPLALAQFPKVPGIPQTLYNYLQANPAADPSGLLRAQGVGGPIPISGSVPAGMALDPRTVRAKTLDPRRGAAFEKDVKAEFLTTFADLVYDEDPDFTVKNQLFFDGMNQYKNSNQPFSQVQHVYVIEDKFTLTRRLETLPSWLRINQAVSLNVRNTMSEGKRIVGDYSNHRSDATASTWNSHTAGMTPNTTFTSSNDNDDLASDGMPWGSIYRTEFSEFGVGVLFDIDLATDTNILVGARRDRSRAKNINYADRYLVNKGTSANPGAYALADSVAEGWDGGTSWSISLSQQLPYGIRPYATLARASVLLDGNNNSLLNDVIEAGHIGSALLKEIGVKGAWLGGKLDFSSAVFEQSRDDAVEADPANVINAYATSTVTRGWQTEIKWSPRENILFSMYSLKQVTRYSPNVGGVIQLDARALGFTDVLDADGNVVYPAEAFLYGGRASIILPDGMQDYEKKQGNPEHQIGMTAIYQFHKNWGATLRGSYLSSTCAGRLCLVTLPSSRVFDVGLFWSSPKFDLKLDVANVADVHYFRARTGDVLGDVIAQAMPGRRTQLTATYRF